MVTVISRFRVRNGLEDQVRSAFLARPRMVENEPGFCGMEVLTDSADPSIFLLITRWTSEAAFRSWHASEAHHHSHNGIPSGLKLDASFTQIVVGNRIQDTQAASHLSDALEGQTVAMTRWLESAETVFALLCGPDGSIRVRNLAAERIFPCDPVAGTGLQIWDFLVCSDAESFRLRFSDPAARSARPFRLNLSDGKHGAVSVEAALVDCGAAFLLLGAMDQSHDLRLQTELQVLTNELSTLARDVARKNKELESANRAIAQIARTDSLTGLANRRTLDELLASEIARANRQHQPLTMILGDVDHFKQINDTYGHVVGDRVLAALGKIFAGKVRPYDVAARFGGEEFVLLFPGTECHEGVAIADRLLKQIGTVKIPDGPQAITMSFGVASLTDGEPAEAFLARTDAALYRAKNGGRNRVEASEAGALVR